MPSLTGLKVLGKSAEEKNIDLSCYSREGENPGSCITIGYAGWIPVSTGMTTGQLTETDDTMPGFTDCRFPLQSQFSISSILYYSLSLCFKKERP